MIVKNAQKTFPHPDAFSLVLSAGFLGNWLRFCALSWVVCRQCSIGYFFQRFEAATGSQLLKLKQISVV